MSPVPPAMGTTEIRMTRSDCESSVLIAAQVSPVLPISRTEAAARCKSWIVGR